MAIAAGTANNDIVAMIGNDSGLSALSGLRRAATAFAVAAALFVAGCQADNGGMSLDSIFPKEKRPIPADIVKTMKTKGMTAASPIMIRIFKEENVLEVWKQTSSGRYDLLKEYEICKWSGKLGPKFKEGDRQAPEGFYTINPWQMNPNSDYYLAFNMGFPNTYDRAHGRTGTHLMVHGACSSAGCYSMTDERMSEIFALAREAFEGGQKAFQVQAYPFKMTPKAMAEHAGHEHYEFWKMLKEGYDHFEITKAPPKVDVCDKRYVFNRIAEDDKAFKAAEACPATTVPDSLALAYSKLVSKEDEIFQKALKAKEFREAFGPKKPAAEAQTVAAATPAGPAAAPATETATAPADPAAKPADAAAATTEIAAEIPVPTRSPRAPALAAEPEKPKRRGLFGLFSGS